MNKIIKKILEPILLPLYRWFTKDREWWRIFLSTVSPVYASKCLYRRALGQTLDLKNPQTLNEKCMWLKLNTYYNHPLITECCDKYLVRNYVKRAGCGEILNELLGVWDRPNEIDFCSQTFLLGWLERHQKVYPILIFRYKIEILHIHIKFFHMILYSGMF